MKKSELGRIIVDKNEKMTRIIDWYLQNKEQLALDEFHAPMESGLIVMQEEHLDIGFVSRPDGRVDMAVYPEHIDLAAMTWIYDPATTKMTDHKFPNVGSKEREQLMRTVLAFDRTDYKESVKYHATMLFAALHEEIIHVDERQSVRRTRKEAKRLRRNTKQPLNLIKRTYVMDEVPEKIEREVGTRRGYTKPTHEVQVRGFYRKTKTGKTVWVKPFSRYKNKGNRELKEYRV